MERTAIFIDAGNLAYMTQTMQLRIDFRKFRQFFIRRDRRLVYVGYYTGVEEQTDGRRSLQPLLDWLADHGYNIISKPTKSYTQVDGSVKVKGNLDIEIVVGVYGMLDNLDHIILVTADGDFTAMVRDLVGKGKIVTVVASRQAGMLSHDLRKAATYIIDLADKEVINLLKADE